jgi:hypothetical protein
MKNPLRTAEDYELYIYTIAERHPEIIRSTVTFVRVGATLARVDGEIEFKEGYRLTLRERIVYARLPAWIDWYGYEIWKKTEKLYWYDSQPHPDDLSLQSTEPHHKHIPPDIKHHRIPAPGMSFDNPNLPAIIMEIVKIITAGKR